MRKFLFALTLAIALGTSAGTLTPDEALSRVMGQMPEKQIGINRVESWILTDTRTVDSQPMVYIFSKQQSPGFLIVSADDTTVPLLGYSDGTPFPGNIAEYPDALTYWLDVLAREVSANATATPSAAPQKVTRNQIAPLVKTQWNQTAPYNDNCPTLDGKRTYTGCVATAMAQIMKYHRHFQYPEKNLSDTYSYIWSYTGEKLSYDFRNAKFDWDKMLDTYTTGGSTAQKAAVADLMFACGVAVNMNYKPTGSASNYRNLAQGMLNRMGYSKGMVVFNREWYTAQEWEDIIYDNLVNYGPIYYEGVDSKGGHAFVCDGYQNGYWHINWGWGGSHDGYFLLSALNPTSATDGYNSGQSILSYIQPDSDDIKPARFLQWKGECKLSTTSLPAGDDLVVTGSYFNLSAATLTYYTPGIVIRSLSNGSTTFVGDPTYANRVYETAMGIYNAKLTVTIPYNLSAGEYEIFPAIKTDDGDITAMKISSAYPQTYNITVTPKSTPDKLYLIGSLKGGQWIPSVGIEMQKDGMVYTAKEVEFATTESSFSFTTSLGTTGDVSEWESVINKNDRYGAPASGVTVTLGTPTDVVRERPGKGASTTHAWRLSGAGKFDISVNFDDMTMTVTKTPVKDPNIVEGQTFDVYFDNTDTQWATPTIFYWGDTYPEWPGVAMRQYKDDLWVATIPNGTIGVLFNAGDGKATQTDDFVAMENHVYNRTGDQGSIDSATEVPDHVYLVGNIDNISWDIQNPIEMTRDNNTMSATVNFTDAGDGYAFFSLITSKGKTWENDVNVSDRYGSQVNGLVVEPDTEFTILRYTPTGKGESNSALTKAWKIEPGIYHVIANFKNNTLMISDPIDTAIQSLQTDNSHGSVFYNMYGIPVSNPTRGLYIRITDGKATQVLIP